MSIHDLPDCLFGEFSQKRCEEEAELWLQELEREAKIQKFLEWMKILALPLTLAILLISAIFFCLYGYCRFRSFLKRIESEIDSSQTNGLHSNRLDQIGIKNV